MTASTVPEFVPGESTLVAPFVRRVVAPNRGVMTGPGTNTYLVGDDRLVVIDPGPDLGEHIEAIVRAAGESTIEWIAVTHTHPDHAPGAAALGERTGAPTFGYGSRDGFIAHVELRDGDDLGQGAGLPLRAIHTPGHASNHLCYLQPAAGLLFSGDHVMSGSTVVISPPDGDMTEYLDSLARVRALDLVAIAPGHGGLMTDPTVALDALVRHRLAREEKVIGALRAAGRAVVIDDLVVAVYDDVDRSRHGIAKSSLWAHLRRLSDDGLVSTTDKDDIGAFWEVHPNG